MKARDHGHQAADQNHIAASSHRLFLEHPRSLGMSWASHGGGAVKIGAELIGAGLRGDGPCGGARLVHARRAGKTVTRIYDHIQTRKAGSAEPGELARL